MVASAAQSRSIMSTLGCVKKGVVAFFYITNCCDCRESLCYCEANRSSHLPASWRFQPSPCRVLRITCAVAFWTAICDAMCNGSS